MGGEKIKCSCGEWYEKRWGALNVVVGVGKSFERQEKGRPWGYIGLDRLPWSQDTVTIASDGLEHDIVLNRKTILPCKTNLPFQTSLTS